MEHRGQQLAGQLIHIGDHQQQALGGGVGGGQGACGQGAVDGAGGTGFRLHLDHLDRLAEDVLPAGGGPLVHVVRHRAGRSNGIDAGHLCEGVGHVRGGGVAVHGFELACHIRSPPYRLGDIPRLFCSIHGDSVPCFSPVCNSILMELLPRFLSVQL